MSTTDGAHSEHPEICGCGQDLECHRHATCPRCGRVLRRAA